MNNLRLRQYESNDESAVIQLFVELQMEENKIEANRRTGVRTAKSYFNQIQEQLQNKYGRLVVAVNETEIIGLTILFVEENDLIEKPGKHIYISDIVVKKEYRRKEIGMKLLRDAETFAHKNGIKEI